MLFEAIYRPSEIKGLSPEAKKLVGRRVIIQIGWKLDSGSYKGQYCYLPNPDFGVGFIPASDLRNIRNISLGVWRESNKISVDPL